MSKDEKIGPMRKIRRFALFLILLLGNPLWAQLPPPEEETKEVLEIIEKAQGDLKDEVYRILVEGAVDLNYVFAESPDSFIVTYKFRMEAQAKNQVDLIKEKGQITTGIEGALAKWPSGECALNVNVGEFPFELTFNKVEEEMIRIDIRIPGEILEKWESNCSFIDAPGSKLNTTGNPEKWLMRALQRPVPAFTDLTIPIDRLHKLTSTLEFEIEQFLVPDPPLGSAEIVGKGKIQIIPERL